MIAQLGGQGLNPCSSLIFQPFLAAAKSSAKKATITFIYSFQSVAFCCFRLMTEVNNVFQEEPLNPNSLAVCCLHVFITKIFNEVKRSLTR